MDHAQAHRERLKLLAWCARYGRQPLDQLLHVDSVWLREWAEELANIVKEENGLHRDE